MFLNVEAKSYGSTLVRVCKMRTKCFTAYRIPHPFIAIYTPKYQVGFSYRKPNFLSSDMTEKISFARMIYNVSFGGTRTALTLRCRRGSGVRNARHFQFVASHFLPLIWRDSGVRRCLALPPPLPVGFLRAPFLSLPATFATRP